MLHDYQNRVAVITGAANGLGRALARELAARKCHLALVDVDAPGLASLRQELAPLGVAVTEHLADVASEDAVQRIAAEVANSHGTAHLLVNNAAISASASFLRTDAADFDRIIHVNFIGVVHGCRAFLPFLESHGQGQILNVASCFAWTGYPRKTAYAAAKGAVRAFSESLRLELRGSGVGVTVLYPGPLHTGIVRSGLSDSEEQRAREERFLASRGLPLDRVARLCLDRLKANPNRIVLGVDYRLLDALVRISPRLASRAVGFAARRAGF